ncbi:MAG TPA: outer membrane lipoprotein carrier protein LolA [Bacteroidales bacterium]|nr:outer membrane lipoprotein carrier protein LolA [Bacteroidales bacterium]HOH22178.1 outer membrane lipoprotein carrier protein LolA [Bacteroidales bacterium]HPB57448.1 outer membrane lipoprotein carrier protein LolA [Bacteroidales bacterium]HPZ02603.1 outer membrane lipoprotein carrier protein LolA [Bacteroidales bacterium]HQB74498.1 outer membrane lipoprotein carrier protein LolA [Bacteroidales bacterium]
MKKIVFLLLSILTFSTVLFAQTDYKKIPDAQVPSVIKEIRSKTAQFQTISSDFVQTKEVSILKEKSVLKGTMYYKKEKQFRWEYTANPRFIFAQNGSQIYTQTGDSARVIKDNSVRLYEEISKLVQSSINGSIFENKKDFSTLLEENNSSYRVTLTPKNRNLKKFIQKITLIIDKKEMLATQFMMLDQNGDSTTIQFSKMKINTPIDNQLFILKK